ncbi:MAG TPA: hypothetical protein VH915_00570 [Pedococcus sp.]
MLPNPAAYVAGVLLLAAATWLGLRRRVARWVAVGAAVLGAAAAVAVPAVTRPGSEGLTGDWAAPAVDGAVVAERALVSPDNTSVDLLTGRTVRLGSVTGGTRFVADDRMIVVSDGRVDSVRLDATARWTWRPARPSAVAPLAATRGQTVLRVCPAEQPETCRLVGVNGRGRQDWATDAPGQTAETRPLTGPDGSLPALGALSLPGSGDGVFLVDPVTGQRTIVPGQSVLPVPDGPLAVTHVSGGRCVTSLYATSQPAWTRVSEESCQTARPQDWFAGDGQLWVQRQGRWTRLALADGRTGRAGASPPSSSGLVAAGRVASVRERVSLGANPFRGSEPAWALDITDATSDERVARLLSREPLALLRLERRAVVVREGSRVVRYTLGRA